MNAKLTFLTLLTVSALISCETEGSVGIIDELTVNAYLHANAYLDTVWFGKVTPLDSSEAPPAPEDLAPVVITESEEVYPLTYSGVEGGYVNDSLYIETGKIYRLEVSFKEKVVSAEAVIPPKPENLVLSHTVLKMAKIDDFSDLQNMERPEPVELTWTGESGGYYFVHVQNIEKDPEVINELFANGPPRPNFRSEPSAGTVYDINVFENITYYGTYEIIVYRVSPEYMALYESNTNGTGSLNEIRTNVQNGFGIFTGINSEKVYLEVKKQ